MKQVLVRYSLPNVKDEPHERGTLCKLMRTNGTTDLYMQISCFENGEWVVLEEDISSDSVLDMYL